MSRRVFLVPCALFALVFACARGSVSSDGPLQASDSGNYDATDSARADSAIAPDAIADGAVDTAATDTAPLAPETGSEGLPDSASTDSGSFSIPDVSLTDSAPPDSTVPPVPYAIDGTLSGLATGDSLVLQDNGSDDITLTDNGPFAFPLAVPSGSTYTVTVLTPPGAPSQTCTVTNGTGTVGNGNVTTLRVSCTTSSFTIGGTLSGLGAGDSITLQDNGEDALTLTANGPFTFAMPVLSGGVYAVTVATQPSSPPQGCTVSAGTGTVGGGNASAVIVNCMATSFAIGGTVSGLSSGNSIVLEDNGGDSLFVAANGSFAFATPVANGSAYAVTVAANPAMPTPETCSVTNGSGSVAGASVASVVVTCTQSTSCRVILTADPTSISGNYLVDPAGTALLVYCDMTFLGGGWTLVQSTNGGSCAPSVESPGNVVAGSCAYLPTASVKILAQQSSAVHVRTPSGTAAPSHYITSATPLAISNLANGLILNANEPASNSVVEQSQWTVVGDPGNAVAHGLTPASILDFSCSVAGQTWPQVNWGCGNSADGWHLVGALSVWNFALRGGGNVPMEVYVR